MDPGTGLLWVALVLAAGSAVPFALHTSSGVRPYRRLGRILLGIGFAIVTVTLLLMIYAFLAPDLTIAYVHSHTRADYPWYYRLSGTWSGDVGSILIWTWLVSLVAFVFSLGGARDSPTSEPLRSAAASLLSVLLAAFLYVLLAADPFRPTAPMELITEGTNRGLGLSPLLLTPLVIVHPPLEFAAYALTAVPFAVSLPYLLMGRGDWTVVAMQWTRAAWLSLTLALLVGALWAYTVLGWGGYWAWDPVETANLVIWIPLTALVHSQLWSRRKGQFAHLSVLLACVPFALTLFATFETRTGVITSVHSFTPVSGVTSPDLGTRLLIAVGVEGAVPLFFAGMIVALLATAAAFLVFFIRRRQQQGATSGRSLLIPFAFLAMFVAAIVWTLLDVRGITEATLRAIDGLGFGRGAVGLVILAGFFIGIPLVWVLLTAPEGTEDREDRWISDDGTMALALALFLLWAAVTISLMILGANSLDPASFEERLPWLLLPVGAVLVTALSWRRLGRRHVPYALLGLGFAIVASYVLFAGNLGALYLPLALAIVLASGYAIGKSWAPSLLPRDLRLAAMLLLSSLLLGFVMWSSGVQEVGFGALALESSLGLAVLGSAASLVGVVLLALGIGRHDVRLWLAAGALGLVLLGFGIGSVLAGISMALLARSFRSFAPGRPRRTTGFAPILRASSPHLIHLGVALVLLGYAGSSYFGNETQVTAAADATTQSFSGYEFRLVRSSGVDRDGDGRFERITAEISVARDGTAQFVAPLQLVWRAEGVRSPRYVPEAFLRTTATVDLSFTLLGFADGTRTYSISEDAPVKAASATLTSAVFQFKESPLTVPLWGGGWLMAVGMGARMWSERGLAFRGREAGERTRAVAEAAASARPGEEHYRRMLAMELEKEDER